MGGEPYDYWVPYEPDIAGVLRKLRDREFQAGRYRSYSDDWDPDEQGAKPAGPRHASIEEALEASEAEGTASILDIAQVGAQPDFMTAGPLSAAQLMAAFGTTKPTRQQVDDGVDELYADIDRGHCVYIVAYEGDAPKEIFFVGYSFD